MRSYLLGFFSEFEYEEEDASYLLSAFDRIAANSETDRLLNEALSAYENDIMIDYAEEILNRARMIADIVDLHPYTVELLVFICMSRRLRELYVEKGIDMQIYRDSILDLKWKLQECKVVKGICGSFVAIWFHRFFNLTAFALGRLQFEITLIKYDCELGGVMLEKEKSRVINVHIPRTGAPMDAESCAKSYALAKEFFADQLGASPVFVCNSWLLFPENMSIVPEKSNLRSFMSEYKIIDWGYNEGQDLWRLFDTQEMNPSRLPTDTSLRKSYAEHLKNGGRVGWGYGIRLG